jgi:hypothetical protein
MHRSAPQVRQFDPVGGSTEKPNYRILTPCLRELHARHGEYFRDSNCRVLTPRKRRSNFKNDRRKTARNHGVKNR